MIHSAADSEMDSECRQSTFVFRLANVAIKRIFLLGLCNDLRRKATISGEGLILLQSDNFIYAHVRVNIQTKEPAAATIFKYLENSFYLFDS